MNDDLQVPDMPEPVDPLDQPVDASQPLDANQSMDSSQFLDDSQLLDDSQISDAAPQQADENAPKAREDYVSELRQTLVSQEGSTRKSGGLIRRITGTLRRTTGSLRGKTGPIAVPGSPPPAGPVIPSELGDDFLVDRLAGASVSEPIYLPPTLEDPAAAWAALEAEALAGTPPDLVQEVPGSADEEPPVLLDNLLETGQPDEADGPAGEDAPDWMSEMRQEAADQAAAPPAPAEKSRLSGSRPLRAFITGLLRRGEEGSKPPTGDLVPDELVTGRLERSLGQASVGDTPAAGPSAGGPSADGTLANDALASFAPPSETAGTEEGIIDEALLFGELPGATQPLEEDVDLTFLERLQARLGEVDVESAPPAGPEISPEDEALIWGDSLEPGEEAVVPLEGLTFTPEDVWGDEEEGQPAAETDGTWSPISNDMYAAAFLTGQAIVPEAQGSVSQDRLLHEALENSPESEAAVSVDDLRAIALEDYQEIGDASLAPSMEDYVSPLLLEQKEEEEIPGLLSEEQDALEPAREAPFWQRLELSGVLKKALIVEAALVVIALLVAVPFFIYMIARGPVYQVGYLLPRPLPANMPYPTGIQLPGGWYFPLQKSTFTEGQWKPSGSEWLEGTELRRVVALPWNPQTEAVIRSFQPGDELKLDMSNNDSLSYTVSAVERVMRSDTAILSDPSPSLVLVLYQEDAEERWVVFSKP